MKKHPNYVAQHLGKQNTNLQKPKHDPDGFPPNLENLYQVLPPPSCQNLFPFPTCMDALSTAYHEDDSPTILLETPVKDEWDTEVPLSYPNDTKYYSDHRKYTPKQTKEISQ